MSTLSVPLTPELEATVNRFVKSGYAANKADVVRKALRRLDEEEAVNAVLRADRETPLKGDLMQLMKKIR